MIRKIIKDENVIDLIVYLFEKEKFSVIGKNNNTIYFQIWTRGMDFGSGLAYSINNEKPVIDYLTKLEVVPENNWYYYESDYSIVRIL